MNFESERPIQMVATPQEMETRVAVAVVNYNTRDQLDVCLASIMAETPAEVIVVDNGSTDGSVEMLRTRYPSVTLLTNRTNPGYGAAANQAVATCAVEYVLLLNSDTRLQAGGLQALSDYLDQHSQAAIVAPRLLNQDGTLQPSCFHFPTPLHALLRESSVRRLIGRVSRLRERYLPTWLHSHPRVVPWVLGAALIIRRDVFEVVGGFDPSFFMYFEEVDLCYRLQAAGWQVHFAPVANVVHVGAASTAQHRSAMTVQLYRSLFHFYRLHFSLWQLRQLRLVVAYLMFRNIVRDTVQLRRVGSPAERTRIGADVAAWKQVLRLR